VTIFDYRARDRRGTLVAGRLEAANAPSAAEQLIGTGLTPVDITETAPWREESGLVAWLVGVFTPRITIVELMLFSRYMHSLLKAGVPIMRALAGLQESTANRAFAAVIADLRIALDSGRALSLAMRQHPQVFSRFYVSMVRIGEATGALSETFSRLFSYLEFEKELRDRISAALRYPLIVLTVVAIAVGVVNFAVIPAFAKIFKAAGVALPLLTRILVGTSEVTQNYWYVIIIVLVCGVVGAKAAMRSDSGRYVWDRYKLRLPLTGSIMLRATLARFSRSLAFSLKAGVPVVQALTVVADVVDNAYVGRRIEMMRDGVERGESVLRTAVTADVFTSTVLQMIAVGEESGEFDSLLSEIADFYEREIDYEIKYLSAQIEPIMTILMGVLVAILALGVFLPLWDLGSVALRK
jgi:MSHA biogenesis protein MshG